MSTQIETLIRELAEQFGTTTEYLWEVMVRQAVIQNSISLSIWGCLMIGVISVIILLVLKVDVIKGLEDDEATAGSVLFIICAALTVLGIMFGVAHLSDWISGIFNPEYWAFKQILDQYQ